MRALAALAAAALLLLACAPCADALCPGAAGEWVRWIKLAWRSSGRPSWCATDGWLNVAELQFFVNGTNVALGKATTALDVLSSTYPQSALVRGCLMPDVRLTGRRGCRLGVASWQRRRPPLGGRGLCGAWSLSKRRAGGRRRVQLGAELRCSAPSRSH